MKQYEMDKVLCEEVIITTQTRRGFGQKLSPIRVITEVFSKTGEKIAEHDPCKEKDTFVALDLVHFAQWCSVTGAVAKSVCVGVCYNCKEPLEPQFKFCSMSCKEAYYKKQTG